MAYEGERNGTGPVGADTSTSSASFAAVSLTVLKSSWVAEKLEVAGGGLLENDADSRGADWRRVLVTRPANMAAGFTLDCWFMDLNISR
jgi:hypothetical protein